jgi:hypothetical protein
MLLPVKMATERGVRRKRITGKEGVILEHGVASELVHE